jgi:hypothetical protein
VKPMLKKILIWGGAIFALYFIAFQPEAAADVVRSLGGLVVDFFAGIGEFISNLA